MKDDASSPEIVVVWYRANQYAAVRAFAEDAVRMEKTFQEWKVLSEKTVNQLISEGKRVRKVDFDHTAFMTWAAARNVQSTQQTRIAFCVEIASRNKH